MCPPIHGIRPWRTPPAFALGTDCFQGLKGGLLHHGSLSTPTALGTDCFQGLKGGLVQPPV